MKYVREAYATIPRSGNVINFGPTSRQGYDREDVRRAIVHVSRFPLFSASWQLKMTDRVHHSYFPHPLPTPYSNLPARLLNILYCLPTILMIPTNFGIVRMSKKHPVAAQKMGKRSTIRKTKPSRHIMRFMASPALIKKAILPAITGHDAFLEYMDWANDHFTLMDEVWVKTRVAPAIAKFLEQEKLSQLSRPRYPIYITPTGDIRSYQKSGDTPMRGRVTMYVPKTRSWEQKKKAADPNHEFWGNHNLFCWHNLRETQKDFRKHFEELHPVFQRHAYGNYWSPLMFLYGDPVHREGKWAAPLLFAGDPCSVFMYALHHGLIPPHLILDDFFIDDRVFNMGPWDLYEEFRLKILAETVEHLDVLMPEFFPLEHTPDLREMKDEEQ